jgi:iron complex transport system substrate-binding protein
MRIVSLVPSATEIVYALGLGDDLVGRSHRCDFPIEATRLPAVTQHGDPAVPGPRLDRTLLADLAPDLLLTDGDDDGPVPYPEAVAAAAALPGDPTLVALAPQSIEGILNSIATVGAFAEAEDEAVGLVELLRERLGILENAVLERRLEGIASRRVVVLEGLDPPRTAGRWVPEMVRRAGGWELLGRDGDPSAATSWERVREVDPEVVVLAPSDLDAHGTAAALAEAALPRWFDDLAAVREGQLFAVDGAGLFARPGPRVIEGMTVLATLCDPEAFVDGGRTDAWIPLGPLGSGAAGD